jgi:hypothetical protein
MLQRSRDAQDPQAAGLAAPASFTGRDSQDCCGRPPARSARQATAGGRDTHSVPRRLARRANRSRAALLVPREGGQWPSRSRCSWAMKAGVRCGAGRMRSLARASDRSVARSRSPRSWDGRAAMTPSAGHPPSRWLQFPRIRAWMANAVLGSRSVVITAGASERCRCGGIAMGQTCGTVIPGLGGEPWRLLPRSRSV